MGTGEILKHAKELVAFGMKTGLVKIPESQPGKIKFDAVEYVRTRRANFRAQGLTCEGKPRKPRNKYPELAGLKDKEYHLKYIQLQRHREKLIK